MPTDPFVAPELADAPRQHTNLAPGVSLPPARAWQATRPGDLSGGQPEGTLLGRPGPNVGYALHLTVRVADTFTLAPHEEAADAIALVAELAMRRAASFGRGPTGGDVDVAATLLGYRGAGDATFAAWRAEAAHGADHHYDVRRAVVDAVPDNALRTAPSGAALADVRAAIEAAVTGTSARS